MCLLALRFLLLHFFIEVYNPFVILLFLCRELVQFCVFSLRVSSQLQDLPLKGVDGASLLLLVVTLLCHCLLLADFNCGCYRLRMLGIDIELLVAMLILQLLHLGLQVLHVLELFIDLALLLLNFHHLFHLTELRNQLFSICHFLKKHELLQLQVLLILFT